MDSAQQRGYGRPPAGGFPGMIAQPGMQVSPDPQGMSMAQQMMMMQQYPQYGMMMPSGHMMPMPMQMQSMGMAPQLTQMLAESARGGRGSNVFFKTRLCHKWRAGNCPFGDKCTYAHGQHELRYIPPELLAQLEREQQMQEQNPQRFPTPPQGSQPQQGMAQQHQMHQQQQQQQQKRSGAAIGEPGDEAGEGNDRNKSQMYFKTRLCIRFMQTGYCARGTGCTFAHGYEDLRLLGHGGAQMPMPMGPPQGMHMQMHMGGGGPGGQGQGIHGGGGRSDPRHRQNGGNNNGNGNSRPPAPIGRAREVSAIVGVSGAAGATDTSARQEAEGSLRSGEAFRGSAYADSAEDFTGVAE